MNSKSMLGVFLIFGVVVSNTQAAESTLFSLKSKGTAGKGPAFQAWRYYASTQPAIWSDARIDCKQNLGPDADLLSLESQEEVAFIDQLLDENGIATRYWLNGRFDIESKGYLWEQGKKPLPPWAPWAVGHPPPVENPLLRVFLNHVSYQGSKWEAAPQTTLTIRYICELPDPTIPVPCYKDNDLIIVLDSSGSIGNAHYELAKNWTSDLARAFSVHSKNRLGLTIFSNGAQKVLNLSFPVAPTDAAAIDNLIKTAPYHGGGTPTFLAIDAVIADYTAASRDVPRNVVVITDGGSSNTAETVAAAQRAQAMGLRMFSVGITDNTNPTELLAIAGAEERVFKAATFQQLLQILAPVSRIVCPD